DQIKVTVFSPANGQSATSDAITLPVPTVIALVKPVEVTPGVASTLTWRVKGPNSNSYLVPIPHALVTLKSQAIDGGAERQAYTDDDGEVSLSVTIAQPKVAGLVEATAAVGNLSQTDTIYTLYPAITALFRNVGTYKGGQPITVTGTFFDTATASNDTVTISPGASSPQVSLDAKGAMTFTTPASTLPGDADGEVLVVANVKSLASKPVGYNYIIPGKTYLTGQGGFPCFIASLPGRTAAPGAVPITLTVFKEDGSVDPADIRLDGIDFHPEWVRDGSGQPFAGHVESVALHVRSGQSTNVDFKGASEFTARNLTTGQTAPIHLQCTTNDAQLARETREAEAAALQAGMVQHIKWESEQA